MEEKAALEEGVDILISTPERLEKLKQRKFLMMSNLSFFVVDEADTFLDSGYQELILAYIQLMKAKQEKLAANKMIQQFIPKMVFVSATYTGPLTQLFKNNFGPNFQNLKKIIDRNTHMSLQNIKHEFIHCETFDKVQPLINLLKEIYHLVKKNNTSILIFCNSIPSCRNLDF